MALLVSAAANPPAASKPPAASTPPAAAAKPAEEEKAAPMSDQDQACQIFGDGDFTHFDLSTLAQANPDKDYLKDGVEFKICDHLPHTHYFARHIDPKKGVERITAADYEPDDVQVITDTGDNPRGVALTRFSDNICKSVKEGDTLTVEPWSFTLVVMCDKTITAKGGGVIDSVDKTDACSPVVTMKHASGCHTWTANWWVRWVHHNPVMFAILHIVLGLILALRGRAMFPVVMPICIGFVVAKLLLYLSAEYEYMEDQQGVILVTIGSILGGALAAFLVRKNLWICVGLAGILAGFSLGALTFAIAAKAAGNATIQSLTAFYIWCGIFAFLGGLACFKAGSQVVIYGTSLLGAYVFMHGWSLLFGGFPDEGELIPRLQSREPVKLRGEVAIYLGVFLLAFVISAVIQSKAEDNQETKDAIEGRDGKRDPSHVELADA